MRCFGDRGLFADPAAGAQPTRLRLSAACSGKARRTLCRCAARPQGGDLPAGREWCRAPVEVWPLPHRRSQMGAAFQRRADGGARPAPASGREGFSLARQWLVRAALAVRACRVVRRHRGRAAGTGGGLMRRLRRAMGFCGRPCNKIPSAALVSLAARIWRRGAVDSSAIASTAGRPIRRKQRPLKPRRSTAHSSHWMFKPAAHSSASPVASLSQHRSMPLSCLKCPMAGSRVCLRLSQRRCAPLRLLNRPR